MTGKETTLSTELDLHVPKTTPSPPPARRGGGRGLLWVLVLLAVANLAVLLADRFGAAPDRAAGLDAGARKALALKLERQGIESVAAEAWREYLAAARPEREEAARIWYRIGTLHEEADAYERALDAYYRSESHAELDGLQLEIARRTQNCLERMGRFAALRHALDDRVRLGGGTNAAGDTVVAEIGARTITRRELDRLIEERIEQQLGAPGAVPDEVRHERKEAMLQAMSSGEPARRFLSQYMMEEVLYRHAREGGLAEEPEVQQRLRGQERALLAAEVLAREAAGAIRITESDLLAWYEAHKEDYVQPADEEAGTDERQLPFEEVRQQVYRDLRMQKEQEVQQALMERLRREYDVVIHTSAFE